MNSGAIPRSSGSTARRLFQSQRWNARVWRSAPAAYGFVHESSRWKNGHFRNIPPALESCERTAWSIPWRLRK